MRVALISDIHGNLAALESVLADLDHERPDQVLCLGDIAATGPQPRETVQRLRELDFPTVMGNTDAGMTRPLSPLSSAKESGDAQKVSEIDRWCAGQLSGDDREYLRRFVPTLETDLGHGNRLSCFHGSPFAFDNVITQATPENELNRYFRGTDANVLAGGHTHEQFLRRLGKVTVSNPGSVGLGPAQAEYAMIESKEDGLWIELRSRAIPAENVRRAALDSGMPHADWWLNLWGRKW